MTARRKFADPHLESLLPAVPFTRRSFVVSSLATGFALSVRPAIGQNVIRTSADGLAVGEAKIPVTDGSMPAYFARPAQGERFPTIVVMPEIFGVHEHIKDICRRLAKAGYLAVAPEIYARQGDAVHAPSVEAAIRIANAKPDPELYADVDAVIAWAARSGKGDPARAGITGFCRGGRQVWMVASQSDRVKAGVAWYGALEAAPSAAMPRRPIDVASQLKAPVLGLYGGADGGISVDQVDRMRAALKAAGKGSEIVLYDDAEHGFFADYRGSYQEKAAQDGWNRMLAWFRKHDV